MGARDFAGEKRGGRRYILGNKKKTRSEENELNKDRFTNSRGCHCHKTSAGNNNGNRGRSDLEVTALGHYSCVCLCAMKLGK